MSDLPLPSAVSDIWPRGGTSLASGGPSISGPTPLGSGPTGFPAVNNTTLPLNTTLSMGGRPPPIPQPPRTPFPPLPPSGGVGNTINSNLYRPINTLQTVNPMQNLIQNSMQNAQNEAYQRRLISLEDENEIRRNATSNLTQMGAQILQGQMDVQEQILQYQYMLEQCMETLDHQNFIVNEQAEELALLRAKMRHFEYFMDAFKHSKEGNSLLRSMSGDTCMIDNNLLCCRDPLALPPPSTSPFFTGGATRVTASTFQPFNPRYRSPNSRARAAAILDGRQNITSPINNRILPTANQRPSRQLGNVN